MTTTIKPLAETGEVKVYWPKNLANFKNPTTYAATARLGPETNHWYWKKGKLYNRTDEIMYMHFMTWKRSMKVCYFDYTDDPESFYISYSHIGLTKSDTLPLNKQAISLVHWSRDSWARGIEALRAQIKGEGLLRVLIRLLRRIAVVSIQEKTKTDKKLFVK